MLSQHHLKNNQKLNLKKYIFELKVRSNIKFKNKQKLLCIWGSFVNKCLVVYTKVFLAVSKEQFIVIKRTFGSGVILKELKQNPNFSVKSEVVTRRLAPSYYVYDEVRPLVNTSLFSLKFEFCKIMADISNNLLLLFFVQS